MDASVLQEQAAAHVRDYVSVVWRRKWLSLLVFVVFTTAGLFVVFRIVTPTYQSQARVAIDQYSPLVSQTGGFAGEAFYQTQYQVIGSSRIAAAAAVKLGWSPSVEMALEDGRALSVQAAVKVSPDPTNHVVTLSTKQPDRDMAARLVNAVADSFKEVTRQDEITRMNQRQNDLQSQIVSLEVQIEAKRKALDEFSKDKNLQQQQQDQALITTQLSALSEAQVRAKVVREQAEQVAADTQKKYDAGEDLADYQPSAAAMTVKTSIRDAELRKRMMEVNRTQKFLSTDPEYAQVSALINDLNKEYDKTVADDRKERNNQLLRNSKASLDTAQKVEQSTANQLAEIRAKLNSLVEGLTDLSRYNELKKEVDSFQAMHDTLEQALLQARINDNSPMLNITILDRGFPAGSPAFPNKTQMAIVVVAMGLIIGAGLAFFLEYMDRSVRKPEDVEQELRMPLVGFIPSMHGAGREDGHAGKIVVTDPSSGPAEAYRKIRAKLFIYNKESHAKVFSVTSSTAGEGKTTLASNLAIAFAQSGANVLLIDADMRHPTMQKVHEIEWTPGLGDYLSGMCSWESTAQKSSVPGLSIIPCGSGGSKSAELLEGARAAALMREARDGYDIVIVDTPPVLGLADTTVLCHLTDATIFVIQSARNSKWLVKRARIELEAAGARVVGAVLNRVRSHRGDYYYYHRYYPKKK
jgi:polysaccharide biosynthesis transport protein